MEITIKNIKKTQVAYVSVKGPYDKIPEVLGEVVSYVMEENLQIIEPPYGIYFNSPMEVSPENLKYEMGIAFIGEAPGNGRVNIKNIPDHQAVSTVYKGPYGEAAQIYQTIIEYAMENNYQIAGPVKEIYLNDPMEVTENELLTEVQFPVVKKS
ncbi:MAG: GyrI-like domain-containing protein [Methanobacterium sp.]|uniref:GyrI-like domain-containing protein n=1 Tax=Methanobacterium sp. TaxID=2164 RepID=UPI003D6596A0|nr:GyrI-like domain-containing protein [Methanobacterium sp.]